MIKNSSLKNALFVFDDGLLSVDDMDREQLIQALEWTLNSAEENKKTANKFKQLLELSENMKIMSKEMRGM